jgi:N-acetylneuraminic acid mutarotase
MSRPASRLFVFVAAGVVAGVVAVVAASGCSLLTSLDGLTGGAGEQPEAGPDAPATEGGPDAAADGADGAFDGAANPDAASNDGGAKVASLYVFAGVTDMATVATVLTTDVHADGTLGAWQTATSLPESRSYAQAVTASGFVAVVGGSAPGGFATSTFIAKILPTGLGPWTALGQFGFPRIRHAAALENDHLYVIGGTDPTETPIADVQFASISATTVGGFSSTSSLPLARSRTAVASTPKYVYVFGGSDAASNAVADVYRAAIHMDGTLGAFEVQSSLPSPRTHAQATPVATNQILVTGGEGLADVVVYDVDPTLGTLSVPRATLALPAKTDHHATVRFASHVYVIGGFRNVGPRLSDVLVGDVAADGTITRWTATTSLPTPLAYHSAAAF